MPIASSNDSLRIYGDANLDEAIDQQDILYLKEVILGRENATDLSDVNLDGRIDDVDVKDLENLISGNAEEITVIDLANRTVAIKIPVKSMVLALMGGHETPIMIAKDNVIGVSEDATRYNMALLNRTGLDDLPTVGFLHEDTIDFEEILELNPDLVLIEESAAENAAKNLPRTCVVAMNPGMPGTDNLISIYTVLGIAVGEKKKSDEIIEWTRGYEKLIEERTKNLSRDQQPTYYLETYDDFVTYPSGTYDGKTSSGCGGRNIADDTGFEVGKWGEYMLDPEWILEQNPDVIFGRMETSGVFGRTGEDAKKELNELQNKTGWDKLDAVKNKRVYVYDCDLVFQRSIIGRLYFAKWLNPELFSDIDPEAVHAEYWNRFLGTDIEGIWAYPPA